MLQTVAEVITWFIKDGRTQ